MKPHGILNRPEDLHCIVFHCVVVASYSVAFWVYQTAVHEYSLGGQIAFIASATMLLGWISAVDVGVNFHNHAHVPIFRSSWMNRWFSRQWTIVGGWPSFLWKYAHINVHHARLLGPHDWTVPRRRPDGRFENILIYIICHWPWRYAAEFMCEFARRPGLRRLARRELPIFAILWSIPFWIDPTMALFLWIVPQWFGNAINMASAMYVQHVGCVPPNDALPHHHSNEYRSWLFNATMFNIGYHIEHHEAANIHWSDLPKQHDDLVLELTAHGAHILECGYYGASRNITNSLDLDAAYQRFCSEKSCTESFEHTESALKPRGVGAARNAPSIRTGEAQSV